MSQFKNNSGKWLTKALFFEFTPAHRPHAVFTLKEEDHEFNGKEYISLKTCFLSCDDPTEYEFANKFLGGWAHWKELQTVNDLMPHIEEWREERDVRLRSKGVNKLIKLAEEEGGYQAAKWLADRGWDENKRGRPTKAEVKKEAKQQAEVRSIVGSDLERIRSATKAK